MCDFLLSDEIQRGCIDDVEHLYGMVGELKKHRRRLISNMFMSRDELIKCIKNQRLRYEYFPGKYLNLWLEEWDFIRLYFYIVELEKYDVVDVNKPIICEFFFQSENEYTSRLVELFLDKGFEKYATYYKWIRKQTGETYEDNKSIYRIHEGYGKRFYESLKEIFDIYSDYVPEGASVNEFLDKKVCYSVYEKNNDNLVGGMVITSRGMVQTEEFVFVNAGYRGKGIGSRLHEYWYRHNTGLDINFISWIKEENEVSERLHSKFGYVKQSTFKITMKKGV